MTGRAFPRNFATASSILFSPPNPWGTEPASGLTSPAAWRVTTTARSTSNRNPAGLNFASGYRSRRPRRRTIDRNAGVNRPDDYRSELWFNAVAFVLQNMSSFEGGSDPDLISGLF